MPNMKISVIVPIYNVQQYIRKCIDSIIEQEDVNVEVILVDDCSPDDSCFIASAMLEKAGIPYRSMCHIRNRGLSVARNSGMAIATGDCVYFLDSDDELYDSRSLHTLAAVMESEDADCVVGNYYAFSEKESYISSVYSGYMSSKMGIDALVNNSVPVMAWNKLVKKCVLDHSNLKFYEGILCEDEPWNFMLLCSCGKIVRTGIPTYRYRIRSGSIMKDSKQHQKRLSDASKGFSLMIDYLVREHPALRKNNRLMNVLNSLGMRRMIAALGNGQKSGKPDYLRIRQAQSQLKGTASWKCIISRLHLMLPAPLGCMMMFVLSKIIACRKRCVRKS